MANECDFAIVHGFIVRIVKRNTIPFDVLITVADTMMARYPPLKLLSKADKILKKRIIDNK